MERGVTGSTGGIPVSGSLEKQPKKLYSSALFEKFNKTIDGYADSVAIVKDRRLENGNSDPLEISEETAKNIKVLIDNIDHNANALTDINTMFGSRSGLTHIQVLFLKLLSLVDQKNILVTILDKENNNTSKTAKEFFADKISIMEGVFTTQGNPGRYFVKAQFNSANEAARKHVASLVDDNSRDSFIRGYTDGFSSYTAGFSSEEKEKFENSISRAITYPTHKSGTSDVGDARRKASGTVDSPRAARGHATGEVNGNQQQLQQQCKARSIYISKIDDTICKQSIESLTNKQNGEVFCINSDNTDKYYYYGNSGITELQFKGGVDEKPVLGVFLYQIDTITHQFLSEKFRNYAELMQASSEAKDVMDNAVIVNVDGKNRRLGNTEGRGQCGASAVELALKNAGYVGAPKNAQEARERIAEVCDMAIDFIDTANSFIYNPSGNARLLDGALKSLEGCYNNFYTFKSVFLRVENSTEIKENVFITILNKSNSWNEFKNAVKDGIDNPGKSYIFTRIRSNMPLVFDNGDFSLFGGRDRVGTDHGSYKDNISQKHVWLDFQEIRAYLQSLGFIYKCSHDVRHPKGVMLEFEYHDGKKVSLFLNNVQFGNQTQLINQSNRANHWQYFLSETEQQAHVPSLKPAGNFLNRVVYRKVEISAVYVEELAQEILIENLLPDTAVDSPERQLEVITTSSQKIITVDNQVYTQHHLEAMSSVMHSNHYTGQQLKIVLDLANFKIINQQNSILTVQNDDGKKLDLHIKKISDAEYSTTKIEGDPRLIEMLMQSKNAVNQKILEKSEVEVENSCLDSSQEWNMKIEINKIKNGLSTTCTEDNLVTEFKRSDYIVLKKLDTE